jgi:hypothetical protein
MGITNEAPFQCNGAFLSSYLGLKHYARTVNRLREQMADAAFCL